MCDARLQKTVGTIDLDISWVFRPDNCGFWGMTQKDKTRYPKNRWFMNGPVYSKNKITEQTSEDHFWALITLFHLMSLRWMKLTGQKPKDMMNIAKIGEKNFFIVFPYWELKVVFCGVDYFLKYKPATKNKLANRISVWTESRNQIKYLSEFLPNIHNVPNGVKHIMNQDDLIEIIDVEDDSFVIIDVEDDSFEIIDVEDDSLEINVRPELTLAQRNPLFIIGNACKGIFGGVALLLVACAQNNDQTWPTGFINYQINPFEK